MQMKFYLHKPMQLPFLYKVKRLKGKKELKFE